MYRIDLALIRPQVVIKRCVPADAAAETPVAFPQRKIPRTT